MRYITDSNGYLKDVSFGAAISCGEDNCVEYTGAVPSGYASLDDWFSKECEKLYSWKIVDGNLEYDSSAVEPDEYEWSNPPMMLDVEYRTTERYMGKPVYTKLLDFGTLPSNNKQKWVSYELTVKTFIRVEGKADFTCFPRIGSFGGTCGQDRSLAAIGVYVGQDSVPGRIAIGIYSDMVSTDKTATVQLWYTKE